MLVLDWESENHNKAMSLCRWGIEKNNFKMIHTHNFYEVFWVEEGCLEHIINGETIKLSAGNIVFISPEDKHVVRCGDCSKAYYVNLCIKCEALEDIKNKYSIPNHKWPWSEENKKHSLMLSPNQITILKELFEEVDCNSMLDHDLLVLQIIKFVQKENSAVISKLPTKLQNAVFQMQTNKSYDEGVAGLAEHSGLSREHIYRLIKKHCNKSAVAFINDLRIEEGRKRLLNTDSSIIQIAFDLGFQSLPYFFKLFKEKTGLTPKDYRKNKSSFATQPEASSAKAIYRSR